jgi:prolyl-tRNA editing enzyme YbaK/EbsC (Cys-tRNA(Pro) deacylase)
MTDTLPENLTILEFWGLDFEVWDCDPDLADTAVCFCERYGVETADSANTIVVRSKTGEAKFAACVVLATHRHEVNDTVRKTLGARKVSFASAEETKAITGMEIGGGNRSSKLKVLPELLFRMPNT